MKEQPPIARPQPGYIAGKTQSAWTPRPVKIMIGDERTLCNVLLGYLSRMNPEAYYYNVAQPYADLLNGPGKMLPAWHLRPDADEDEIAWLLWETLCPAMADMAHPDQAFGRIPGPDLVEGKLAIGYFDLPKEQS